MARPEATSKVRTAGKKAESPRRPPGLEEDFAKDLAFSKLGRLYTFS